MLKIWRLCVLVLLVVVLGSRAVVVADTTEEKLNWVFVPWVLSKPSKPELPKPTPLACPVPINLSRGAYSPTEGETFTWTHNPEMPVSDMVSLDANGSGVCSRTQPLNGYVYGLDWTGQEFYKCNVTLKIITTTGEGCEESASKIFRINDSPCMGTDIDKDGHADSFKSSCYGCRSGQSCWPGCFQYDVASPIGEIEWNDQQLFRNCNNRMICYGCPD